MSTKVKDQKSTQTSEPWSPSQPYLKEIMQGAQGAYQSHAGDQYFPGSTVIPWSPQTIQSRGMIGNLASQGSPGVANAQNVASGFASGQGLLDPDAEAYFRSATRGDYLDPTNNPAWTTMLGDVTNQTNAQFGAGGRTGSGMHGQTLARGLAQGASGIYGAERGLQQQAAGNLQDMIAQRAGLQMQAAGMAPGLDQAQYYGADRMGQLGTQAEDLEAQKLADQMARYDFNQNKDWNNLNNYNSLVQGFAGLGGTQTTSQPVYQNKGSGILGGISSGLGLLSMFAGL